MPVIPSLLGKGDVMLARMFIALVAIVFVVLCILTTALNKSQMVRGGSAGPAPLPPGPPPFLAPPALQGHPSPILLLSNNVNPPILTCCTIHVLCIHHAVPHDLLPSPAAPPHRAMMPLPPPPLPPHPIMGWRGSSHPRKPVPFDCPITATAPPTCCTPSQDYASGSALLLHPPSSQG